MTNADALEVGCAGPGTGVRIDKGNDAPDAYTFTNSVFRGNAQGPRFHDRLPERDAAPPR